VHKAGEWEVPNLVKDAPKTLENPARALEEKIPQALAIKIGSGIFPYPILVRFQGFAVGFRTTFTAS
jgi:hypothetical protein